ncbi:MAG: thioredoxin domain-containing protein [Bdellovibrionales bacterium]
MRSLSLALALFVALAAGLAVITDADATTPPAATPVMEDMLADRVIGKADAPVTILEFASLTCHHCATFHLKTLPELEKQAIETGKAKIIFRDFPLDGMALKASALARCLPEDQYFPFIKVLFAQQEKWAHDPEPTKALARYAALAGLSPDKAEACMNDTKILDALAQGRLQAAEKYKIQATPTLVLNDGADTVQGGAKVEDIMAKINKLLPATMSKPVAAPADTKAEKPAN